MKFVRLIIILLMAVNVVACNINTMYNARNYYKSAQNRPLNANGKPSAQAVDDYTKAIKKCGIIISERKKGAQLDDAVFLMAKALYYKGNSAFQAKDQFNNLVNAFPNSPFVPESHLFLARVLRELNQPKDAERKLEEFVSNSRYRKQHPKALLLMTDFAIQDKDYIKAQYWLERIIRDYPKTKEYRQAYFLFGKNYYEQKNYVASLEAFEKMEGSRGIDKNMKLDTRYYIALNQLELGDLDKAWRSTTSLLRAESRPDKLPLIRLTKVRILFAKGETEDAEKEVDELTKAYPRTESSAAAYYYLAEHQYYNIGNHALAAATYSRVRSEFPSSAFATISQSKSTAVNNVSPRANLNSETGLKQFLDYHYQAAESFLSQLNLPDSAIAVYNKVIAERDSLSLKRLAILAEVDGLNSTIDSLQIAIALDREAVLSDSVDLMDASIIDTLEAAPDSIDNSILEQVEVNDVKTVPDIDSDSLSTSGYGLMPQTEAVSDTVAVVADSMAVLDSLVNVVDTLVVADEEKEPQSDEEGITEIIPEDEEPQLSETAQAMQQEIAAIETQLKNRRNKIKVYDDLLLQFDTEIVPFCLFAIGSVLKDKYPDREENAAIYSKLHDNYPDNKYTRALRALQQGQAVRIIDPIEEREEAKLDSLFGIINTDPVAALAGLEEMRVSSLARLKLAATFRLGWYYSFDAPDTIKAVPYLKEVLDTTGATEYIALTRRFYDGRKFLLRNPLPGVDSLAVTDSTIVVDSLQAFEAYPATADSINSVVEPPATEPELTPELGQPDNHTPSESSPVIKEEEAPLE